MSAAGPVRKATVSRDDWETPPALFNLLNKEFGFIVDGAANSSNSKCSLWLGPGSEICEDAFLWNPHSTSPMPMWLNAPYGKAELPCRSQCTKKTCTDPETGIRKRDCLTVYRPGMEDWMNLVVSWRAAGHTVVTNIPNGTENTWYRICYEGANEIRHLLGRVQYLGGDSNVGGTDIHIWRPGPKPATPHMWLWRWR